MTKTEDGIVAKIVDKGKEKEFSNLEMIDFLYKNSEDIIFEYDSLSQEEQAKIADLYSKIKSKIAEAKNIDGKELETTCKN